MLIKLHSQRGQAITEFLTAMIVLLPLLLIVPLLAKYTDILQNATVASRFTAFEYALNDNGSPGEKTDKYFYQKNPFWNDNQGKEILQKHDFETSQWRFSRFPPKHLHNMAGSPGLGLVLDQVRWGVIATDMGSIPWLEDTKIDLKTHRYTVISFDPWTAKDSNEVKTRIEYPGFHWPRRPDSSVGMGGFNKATPNLKQAAALPIALYTAFEKTMSNVDAPDIFKLDVDLVPEDRMQ